MFDTMNYLNYHNAFNSKNDDDGYDWDDDDMEYILRIGTSVCKQTIKAHSIITAIITE